MTDQHRTGALAKARDRGSEPPDERAGDVSGEFFGVDTVVSWVERLEWQQRVTDAARLRLIASAIDEVTGGSAGARFGDGASREIRYRSLRAELATALALSEYQVETQMDLAHRLAHGYPTTLSALERGELSLAHGRVVADAGAVIGVGEAPEVRRRRTGYEAEVLGIAVRETPNRLRPIARRIAERWAARSLETRHREAAAARCVRVVDGEDGMADLIAHLPAVQAYAIHDRLTRIARAAERGERTVREAASASVASEPGALEPVDPDSAGAGVASLHGADLGSAGLDSAGLESAGLDAAGLDAAGLDSAGLDAAGLDSAGLDPAATRTRDQFRADVLADLLLCADERVMLAGSPGEAIRASVQVSVPAQALLSADGDADPRGAAPVLAGFGPIDGGAARELAGRADAWIAVRSDAAGEVLSVERYRPSEQMRRVLGVRDLHCRFPGCRVPVSRCDLDHTVDAALGGPTATDNLAHLCRGHHVIKHHGGWHAEQQPGGVLRWTSPTGRTCIDRLPGTRPSLGSAVPLGPGSPDPGSPGVGPTGAWPPGAGPPGAGRLAGAGSASGARADPVRFGA